VSAGAGRFAEAYSLGQQEDLGDYLGQLEFEALFLAEGVKIGGPEKIRAFLANFGGLSFSLAALVDFYGREWESWIF
jgi:hypothetical protein